MANFSSTLSAPLDNFKTANLKTLLNNSTNIEMTDINTLNKYIIYNFDEYAAVNIKDYSLWDYIQVNIGRFKGKHFNQLYNST